MKRVFGALMSLAVSVTVLTLASPADAAREDRRACVTAPEFRRIEPGMVKREVVRLLDGRGQWDGPRQRKYDRCGSKSKVVVRFDKKFTKKNARVVSARIVKPKPKPKPKPENSGSGSHAPVSAYDCPSHAPIKGNADSMIYHPPSSPWYDATKPEECFATESAAVAAGYRRAKY